MAGRNMFHSVRLTLGTGKILDGQYNVQSSSSKSLGLCRRRALKSDFDDGKALEEALNRKAVGTYYTLVIVESESKGKTYRNYDLNEAEGLPNTSAVEVNDDDLPF